MLALASGLDDRAVEAHREEKSISAEETYEVDLRGSAALTAQLLRLADKATARLRAHGLVAGRVSVKIRTADFTTHTRQRSLEPATHNFAVVSAAAKLLLDQWLAPQPEAAVRLLGVSVGSLQTAAQADLFDCGGDAGARLDAAVDGIRDRFGAGMLTRASLLLS